MHRIARHQVQRDKPETGRADRLDDGRSSWVDHRTRQVRLGQFHARDVAMVPDPQIGESQTPQCRLGCLDLMQLHRHDLLKMRNSGRQTRRGGLVRTRQPKGAGETAYCCLVQAGVRQRPQDATHGGCPSTRTVRTASVIGILSVCDGPQPIAGHHIRGDATEQLVLAVKAAVRPILDVLSAVAFVRAHLNDLYPPM
jgi:hypothetical protein